MRLLIGLWSHSLVSVIASPRPEKIKCQWARQSSFSLLEYAKAGLPRLAEGARLAMTEAKDVGEAF